MLIDQRLAESADREDEERQTRIGRGGLGK